MWKKSFSDREKLLKLENLQNLQQFIQIGEAENFCFYPFVKTFHTKDFHR